MPKIYFISGHRDLTPHEFLTHYLPLLNKATAERDAEFVVGDYEGADRLAQSFFCLRGFRRVVTVFHMGKEPMNLESSWFKLEGGFLDDESRDAAMTMISHEDIAWVRPGKENSGTAINLRRRATYAKILTSMPNYDMIKAF